MPATEVLYGWTWNGYNPVAAGWSTCTGSREIRKAVNELFSVYYVLSGEGSFTVNDCVYSVAAGDMLTVIPGEGHCCRGGRKTPMEIVWITFAVSGTVPYRFVQTHLHEPAFAELFQCIREHPDHGNSGRELAAACLDKIAGRLVKEHNADIKIVNMAAEHIQAHFRNKDLTVAGLAEHLGVPQFRMTRAFTRVKNMPPMEYLIRYRFEKACEYLRSQEGPMRSVAEYVGYSNYTTFARMFRKYYGVTPKEYRRRYLK